MMDWLAELRGKWSGAIERYGRAAIGTYVVIFAVTLIGSWLAIRAGVDVGTSVAELGTLGAAYAATKLMQPLRIAATLVVTPIVARVLGTDAGPPAAEP